MLLLQDSCNIKLSICFKQIKIYYITWQIENETYPKTSFINYIDFDFITFVVINSLNRNVFYNYKKSSVYND